MNERDFDCCQTCQGCGRAWCAMKVVSPGEKDGLCVDCWLVEDPRDVAVVA